MPEDPTKVLDALQDLVRCNRVMESAPPINGPSRTVESLRAAIAAAESDKSTRYGARVDHLRRVEARGPGVKTIPVGPYRVELVHFEPFDPTDRLRVWHDGHLVAEVELSQAARRNGG